MVAEQLQITCGNPSCKARLLVKNPHKLSEAKCPVCGHLNPIPTPAPHGQPMRSVVEQIVTEHPTVLQKPPLPSALGWLTATTDGGGSNTFILKLGTNTVGRDSKAWPSDHMLTTDDAMSRQHCTIDVRINKAGTLDYILQDGAARPNGWKHSLNGTYLNGATTRLGEYDRIYLNDGDVIQIGSTQLVLKALRLPELLQQAYRSTDALDQSQTVIGIHPSR